MANKTLSKVRQFIAKHDLLTPDDLWLVALSGGADSVCLLLILRQLGYSVEAIHCNFHLRGEESIRDEQFCMQLCQREGIKLHLSHFDTREYASVHHVSIEMAARQLRYRYFAQLCNDLGAASVCVAHHQEDSVETILINLVRGTGVKGLTGIKPKNAFIVRPLLCLTRSEIEKYLSSLHQDFVTDSTNLVDDVVRNKIRLQVIPLLKEINPSFNDSMMKTAERLIELENVGQHAVQLFRETHVSNTGDTIRISKDALLQTPSPAYILFELLRGKGFTSSQFDSMLAALSQPSGRHFTSATHRLLVDRQYLILEPFEQQGSAISCSSSQVGRICNPSTFPAMKLPEPGLYIIDDKTSLRLENRPVNAFDTVISPPHVAMLDADKVQWPLLLRRVKTGDRFQPLGMKGTKLLSRFMIDSKITLFDKQRQLVLADAQDQILWVLNLRPDHRFRITSQTQQVLLLTLNKNE